MDHLVEIWKLLPILKEAVGGSALSDLEAVVTSLESLYADWKKLQAEKEAPAAK